MASANRLGADIIMASMSAPNIPPIAHARKPRWKLTLRWASAVRKYFEEHKQEVHG